MSAMQNYTLGATEPELRRLVDLASHEEDRVIEACARAGIGEGARVVDVGCGPLGALAALARVVGPQGSVTGIDASANAIAKAQVLLPANDFPQVRLIHADLRDLSPGLLDEEQADLVYCRLMLLHQQQPAETLRRMAALLRPGGAIITHEPSDQSDGAPASEPFVPAMTRIWELVIAAARSRGAQTDFGRRGKSYLEEAGLALESHRAYYVHYPAAVGFEIPRVALQSLRPVLAEKKLASEEEIVTLDRELQAAKQNPHTEWVSSPLMFEWVARHGGIEN